MAIKTVKMHENKHGLQLAAFLCVVVFFVASSSKLIAAKTDFQQALRDW